MQTTAGADAPDSPEFHRRLRALAFFINLERGSAKQYIRVLVTLEALAELDGVREVDIAQARECFERFRPRLQAAASARLLRIGRWPPVFEGVPSMLLMSGEGI